MVSEPSDIGLGLEIFYYITNRADNVRIREQIGKNSCGCRDGAVNTKKRYLFSTGSARRKEDCLYKMKLRFSLHFTAASELKLEDRSDEEWLPGSSPAVVTSKDKSPRNETLRPIL